MGAFQPRSWHRLTLSCDGSFVVVVGAVANAAPVIARETPAAPNGHAQLARRQCPQADCRLRT